MSAAGRLPGGQTKIPDRVPGSEAWPRFPRLVGAAANVRRGEVDVEVSVVRVEHTYRPEVHACSTGEPLQQVARRMSRHRVGVLAVCDHGRLVGVISERDVVDAVGAGADVGTATAGDHASHDVQVCTVDDDSTTVADLILAAGMRHMPVVRDGQVVGIVSMRDLLAVEVWA
jgi:CBS domain-containing protein